MSYLRQLWIPGPAGRLEALQGQAHVIRRLANVIDRPAQFERLFAEATGFTDPDRRDEDIAGARRAIEFVRHFPEPRLGLGGAGALTLTRFVGAYTITRM